MTISDFPMSVYASSWEAQYPVASFPPSKAKQQRTISLDKGNLGYCLTSVSQVSVCLPAQDSQSPIASRSWWVRWKKVHLGGNRKYGHLQGWRHLPDPIGTLYLISHGCWKTPVSLLCWSCRGAFSGVWTTLKKTVRKIGNSGTWSCVWGGSGETSLLLSLNSSC